MRMPDAEFNRGSGSHGEPNKVCLTNIERAQHNCGIIRRTLLGVGICRHWNVGGWPTSCRVADAAIAAREIAHLRLPTQMMAAELVQEQDRVSRARLFVVELHAII